MDALSIAAQILVGISLAACCGLRAFLPPFVLGLAVRLNVGQLLPGIPIELNPAFNWLGSNTALIVFGTAVVLELLADKVPVIDHALDVVQTVVRPLAGGLVVAASFQDAPVPVAAAAGLIAGAPIAGAVHVGKAKIRILSTLGTGGLASPVLSVIEDALALLGSILSVVFALFAILLIVFGIFVTRKALRGFHRRAVRLQENLENR
ncbi:MAG: DUF4126 domain-containing protein [Acidobacteria bacterium]|nr:DUF4126 domain-containing protein [Acidobacteriota bacterium]